MGSLDNVNDDVVGYAPIRGGKTAKMAEKKLSDLYDQLQCATVRYKACEEASEAASREQTIALNQLNNVQRAVDECIKGMKAGAPSRSDWQRPVLHGQEVK